MLKSVHDKKSLNNINSGTRRTKACEIITDLPCDFTVMDFQQDKLKLEYQEQ